MLQRISKASRDLWLPALVGVAGALIALGVWGLMVSERRERLLDASADIAAETRQAIELGLAQQLEVLSDLSNMWAEFGLRDPAAWEAEVGNRVDGIAGLASVAWVDLDEPLNRITAGEAEPHEDGLDVDEARLHADSPHMVGPERRPDGGLGYRIFLPVRTPEDHAGVLVARFAIDPLLEALLRARARGYALSVYWGEEEIYRRGTPSSDRWQDWWHGEEEVFHPFGTRWRMVQRPTPELATARLTALPHYLLGAGLLLAGVLALAVHQLRVISRQSHFLVANNLLLERRGHELEDQVADRTRELEEAVAELEAFNYSVSHDLRTPLGAILNFAAILDEDYRERPLDGEGRDLLARIGRSGQRAVSLLDGLLQLSRAGRAALDIERIDMTALARDSFAQIRAAEPDAEVEFQVDALPEAFGDRALLGDVFNILFGNALKYSRGAEKRRITVSAAERDGETLYSVIDNGQGFDMRYADKLFRVFERLHASEDIEGTGVGLAMVARIVKRHGGRVEAEGRPGEGARFSFALPDRGAR